MTREAAVLMATGAASAAMALRLISDLAHEDPERAAAVAEAHIAEAWPDMAPERVRELAREMAGTRSA